MRSLLIISFVLCISCAGLAQTKTVAEKRKELTDTASGMRIFGYQDGRYRFTYQNVFSQKPDPFTVFFKDRAEAILFVKEIKKAFVLKEGSVNKVDHGNSKITLMPVSNGSVFMRVVTKGRYSFCF